MCAKENGVETQLDGVYKEEDVDVLINQVRQQFEGEYTLHWWRVWSK